MELESGRLEVCKVPGREGGYVRAIVSVNCEWYQRFCANYIRARRRYPKIRTYIKRRNTEVALKRMLKGDLSGVYAERILALIEELSLGD